MRSLLKPRVPSACLVMLISMSAAGMAQDRRTVMEPTIPQLCGTLRAALVLRGSILDPKDEGRLDTRRVQHALDGCGSERALELASDSGANGFLIGPITIPTGVTLLIDGGVTVIASRDPRVYDLHPGSCGVVNDQPSGCKPVISITHAPHAAIMGNGVIDGRGGETLLKSKVTWWDLAEKARASGRQQVPRLIEADYSDDLTVYRITLRNSPNFHLVFNYGRGFTVWGVKIDSPQKARNTDGVDPGSAEDITVAHSFIRTGDDNIAIKGSELGVGYMTVVDNHFYYGHGMSIGSETYGGVHDILVKDLTLDGPDNGIRIKSNASRGGLVQHIKYSNVCIRNSKWPMVLDTNYQNPGLYTNRDPEYRDIHFDNVRISGGGHLSMRGFDPNHQISAAFDGVMLDNPKDYQLSAKNISVDYGPGPVNFRMTGSNVIGSGNPVDGTLASCGAMYIPFEAHP